jgi:hypothetical protein
MWLKAKWVRASTQTEVDQKMAEAFPQNSCLRLAIPLLANLHKM